MEHTSYLQRHHFIKDILGIIIFIICVFIGTALINTFLFRSYSVIGPSMEKTLYTGDRLMVNRTPVTIAQLQNKQYVPERGQVIVFKNPRFNPSAGDEYVVKRVIAFPGERVTVKDGILTVYNAQNQEGFQPDDDNNGEPGSPTSGNVDTVVTDNTLFVAGDHRQGDYSFDSRSGLGLIPYYDVIGPVSARIYPFDKIRLF